MSVNEAAKFSLEVGWQEGREEDFKELKELREAKQREKDCSSAATGDRTDVDIGSEMGSISVAPSDIGSSDDDGDDVDDPNTVSALGPETTDEDVESSLSLLEQKLSLRGTSHQKQEDSEDDEEEEEPEKDQHGPRLLWLCSREAEETSEEELLAEIETHLTTEPKCVSHRDADGYTAMHRAAYAGHKEIVRRLLAAPGGRDLLLAQTPEGWHPLHSACRWNRADVAELLLTEGAEANARTQGNQTPLHLAAFAGNSPETLQILFMVPNLESNVKNCQGDTPRDIALRNGNSVQLFEGLVGPAVNQD